MYKRITDMLNLYLPHIKIDDQFMEYGYIRSSLNPFHLNLEIFKDSYSISIVKFDNENAIYGKTMFVFKVITYIYTGDDAITQNGNHEHYDPNTQYSFRRAEFYESAKISLRHKDNIIHISNTSPVYSELVIYRDDEWNSYIVPKNMSEEEHFQNSMQYKMPEYKFFKNIYELGNVKTYSQHVPDNIGKISYIDLCFVDDSDAYLNDLEASLKLLVELSRKINECKIA